MAQNSRKDLCGEIKEFGRQRFICARKPHKNVERPRLRNHRDGIYFFDQPAAESHRFINPNRL